MALLKELVKKSPVSYGLRKCRVVRLMNPVHILALYLFKIPNIILRIQAGVQTRKRQKDKAIPVTTESFMEVAKAQIGP
jgi:hypothetical protein